MAQKQPLSTRVPEEWVKEIDDLIVRKFPHWTRSAWLHGVIEHELRRQRDGKSKDTRIDELLTMVPLVKEIHAATVVKGVGDASD